MLRNQQFWLTAERCLYWQEEGAMILSDLHFGKTGHFRKAGIPVPPSVYKEDLQRLFQQIQYFQPKELIFVGDLFHSRANLEHEMFKKWRFDLPSLAMHLVMGNHDLHSKHDQDDLDLIIHEECLQKGEFSFVHDFSPNDQCPLPSAYMISGHLHPGIRLQGNGKQSLRFPCFYFTPTFAVLPAFSRFTGMALIDPKRGDDVYAIVDKSLIQVNA
ncbi:MAG: ligase-associated DNA damage response endonuclease PdeM [Chitinophagaceae bacterium]